MTESISDRVFSYHLVHPSVMPKAYSLSSQAGDGLTEAEAVLESADFGSRKADCQQSALEGQFSESEHQTSQKSVSFNCDDGVYVWMVSGWRVEASADGTIHAFIFGNSSAEEVVEDDDNETSSMRYRVVAMADGGNPRQNYLLSSAFASGSIFQGCSTEQSVAAGSPRRLGVQLPGTNWCGMGQCGCFPQGDNYCLGEFEGDWACRRHDSCQHYNRWSGVPVAACSCDADLWANSGSGIGPAKAAIAAAYHPHSPWPCVSHHTTCRSWGWKEHGRRRRWGWSSWGVVGTRPCENWNYGGNWNKYNDPYIHNYGYLPQANGFDINSRESWQGCIDNTVDWEVESIFGDKYDLDD